MKVLVVGRAVISADGLPRIEREDFEPLFAATVEEGLACLAERPEIVILDLRLAANEGAEVIRRARRADLDCQVILVTEERESEVSMVGGLELAIRSADREELGAALTRAARARRERSQTTASVLILEDDEPTLDRLIHILRKEGYQVDGAVDGLEGLRLLETKRFDLVLADVKMPNKSGLDVLRETRRCSADVEFVMTTGYGSGEVVIEALREGAVCVLRKPIDIDHMLVVLQKAFDGQKVRRTLARRDREITALNELVAVLTSEKEAHDTL